MRSKKTVILITGTAFVLAGSYLLLRYSEDKKYEREGTALIKRIEKYRTLNGSLPNTAAALGLKESMGSGPYYKKTDSSNYIVFFNLGFDDTKTYYSQTQEWKNEP